MAYPPNEDLIRNFHGLTEFAWTGATACEWWDGNTGVRMYGIAFRNGMKFVGDDPEQVWHEAATYHLATRRLTGEAP